MKDPPPTSKRVNQQAAVRVLLVRLRTPAPVLREAIGAGGLVVEARTLLQACLALETVRPSFIIVGATFPRFEVEVLRTKAAIGTGVHFVADDADVETLMALVDGRGSSRRRPQL